MIEQYKTVATSTWIKLTIRNSKFHGKIFHVRSESEVNDVLRSVEDEFKKPTHIVYAYRLLEDENVYEYATDAGEPTHSSGPPILKVLIGEELVNVLLVVVRYFGGTKLGIGGLVKAYTETTQEAIKNAKIVVITNKKEIILETTYKELGEMLYKIEQNQGKVLDIIHGAKVQIKALIPVSAGHSLKN
ncbi:MAG: YigZ family protein [Candidatus Cloacimonetes bacterium]|nr:YigZ family protein [Candidatus Cloacimonadota bacterium]